MQQTVDRLRADGLVTAEPDPGDRRAPVIRLTESGWAALGAMGPVQARWVNELAGALPPEDLATALRVLRALRAGLDRQEG